MQVVNNFFAILEYNGGNHYTSWRKGTSFGIRRIHITKMDGEEVMVVPESILDGDYSHKIILMEIEV